MTKFEKIKSMDIDEMCKFLGEMTVMLLSDNLKEKLMPTMLDKYKGVLESEYCDEN